MSEGGDFESMGLGGASEQKEINMEQVQEEQRQTQAAIKQLQKEEGQVKAQDNNLAQIIVQFLADPNNTDMFLLISRVVAQNITSEIILAVISLIHQQASDEVVGYLASPEFETPAERALVLPKKASFSHLSPELQATIDSWVKKIDQVSAKRPQRSLEALVIQGPQPKISESVVQLTSVILRKYLASNNIEFDFDDLHEFSQAVYVEIIKNLERLISGQKHLT